VKKALTELMEKYPNFLLPYYILSEIYENEGNYFGARKTLEISIKNNPYDEFSYKRLYLIAEKIKDEELKKRVEQAINFLKGERIKKEEKVETVPFITKSIAELYESQGYYKEALAVYERIYAINPEDKEVERKIEELKRRIYEEKNE